MGFLRILAWLAVLLLVPSPAQANESRLPGPGSVALAYRYVVGVPVTVITVDLNSQRIVVKPLLSPRGRRQSVHSLLGARPPLAAVTGTFFDMKTGTVVGSLAYQGRLLEEGSTGSTLAIDRRHRARLVSTAHKLGRYVDWSDFDFAISGGPTLVRAGRRAVSPWREGFRDPGLFGPRRRTALGVTRNNRLLLVGVEKPVDVHTLADIMRALGAVNAINLDGGTSASLYYRGQLLMRPRRSLTNLVAIYELGREGSVSLPSRSLPALRHYQRGLERRAQGLVREARSHLSKAVAYMPHQARYRSALADLEARCGHRRAAVDHYLRAASLYLAAFKPQLALTMTQRATRTASWRSDAQLLLARCALASGQTGLARQALRTVLQRRPGHPVALKLLRKIPQGRG